MNKAVRNPFDDVKLQGELRVILPGYGEKRDRRINIALDDDIREKATAKCDWIGCKINEAANQLLYIWSKGEKDNADIEVEGIQPDYENISFFAKRKARGNKYDNRISIALEKTIYNKSMAKCKRINCSFNEAVNQVFRLWTENDKDKYYKSKNY